MRIDRFLEYSCKIHFNDQKRIYRRPNELVSLL